LPIKFLLTACLATIVALTGCATPAGGPAVALQPATAETPAPQPTTPAPKPQYPGGPLQPITAAQAASLGVMQLAPPADLWERIRRGFAMPNLESDLVRDREQWYATRPDYIFRMTERSRKYMFHIVEELELRNMPTELALLPFIESAFNPQAVSTAKAAGMWQFIPSTGKTFDLKQNAFRDDRRDVLASTRAALDYLQKLHTMFGDWQLALAAYNWGEGNVARAIARNQRGNLGTSYADLNMPMETRLYVPKLQAVKNIVATPNAFNSRLPDIGNHPYFDTVTINRDIDVALAAKLAEVPLDDFKALNPSANKPVILAAGTPQVLLPWDNATVFQRNLDAFTGTRLASWTVWVAPTTMRIADAAKRVGMSEGEFRAVNNIPPRMLIKAGSTLLMPRAASVSQDVALHIADNGQMALAPELVLRRTVLKAGKNDSVASIANRYRVSAANVASWNKVNAHAAFKLGQQVVLFLPAQATPPSSRSVRPAAAGKARPAARRVVKAAPVRKTAPRAAKK
jgi:membrane-bound lytic murein transglycosylase D